MRLPLIAVSTAFALLLTGCMDSDNTETVTPPDTTPQFHAEMVQLDKLIAPTLFYSNISNATLANVADSKTSLTRLKESWTQFKNNQSSRFSSAVWSSGITQVDSAITTAETNLASLTTAPADQSTAHTAIEQLRSELKAMRETVGVDWWMDQVTAAHGKMAPIAGAVATYDASAKDQTALDALCTSLGNGAITEFATAWSPVSNGYSANEADLLGQYQLNNAKGVVIDGARTSLDTYLAALQTSINDGSCDSADYANAAKIKPNFVKFYLGFGDFLAPFANELIAVQRALVPALYCTTNPADAATVCMPNAAAEPVAGTLDYLNTLQATYDNFVAHYPSLPAVLNWKSDLDSAATALTNAINTVTTESQATSPSLANVTGTYYQVEAVRTAFYNISQKLEAQGMVMDIITEYSNTFAPMLAIVTDSATGGAKQALSSVEVALVKAVVDGDQVTPSLQASFSAMRSAIDTMDEAKMGVTLTILTPKLNAQQNAIDTLETALAAYDAVDNPNDTAIAADAFAIKTTFVDFYNAMGSW